LVFKLLLDPKEDQGRGSLFTPTGKLKIKNDHKGSTSSTSKTSEMRQARQASRKKGKEQKEAESQTQKGRQTDKQKG
jgi:hypothetical protein